MKIHEIHIYGYGKLENYHISSMNHLQVFYGENEAGKSTIMSFIHSILFGFPAKQSTELRYEPRDHAKYGGRIKAFFPGIGMAVIERVKGKAAGDVTVSLEDGTIGSEDLLKDLLHRMDKSIYQAIFSFNVHGLQNIQSMRGEELGRYLFSAGTLGTDKLFLTESILLKEMELRFKPSGKKPVLNEKLKELKELQASMKQAEQQNSRYSELLSEKEAIESTISALQSNITELEQKGTKLREYKRNEHLVIEEASLKSKLEEHGKFVFPEDGLIRFEKLDTQLKPVEARILWIREKRTSSIKEAEVAKPDSELLGMEAEIESRLGKAALYDQLNQEKRLLELKIDEISEEISQINDSLHTDFNEDSIQGINTSFYIKEEAESIQHRQERLQEKRFDLEAGFDEEKTALVELEASAEELKKELLADGEREQLAEDLAMLENKEQIQSDLNHVQDQINAHQNRLENEDARRTSQKKKDLYQLMLIGSVFLAVFAWGFADSDWVLSGIGIAGLLVMLFIYVKSASSSPKFADDEVLTELRNRERGLKDALNKQPSGNLFAVKSLLDRDKEVRLRQHELEVKIEQQHARYEKVIQQFESWEAEEAELKEKRAAIMNQLGLASTAHAKIYDCYQFIEKQKQFFREKKRTQERLNVILDTLGEIDSGLELLSQRFLQTGSLSSVETAALLKKRLREAIDQKARYHELALKVEELNEEQNSLEKELLILTREKNMLLKQASAADEDGFRIKAKIQEQIHKWSSRLADIHHQLSLSGISNADKETILTGPALEDQINENSLEADRSKKELSSQYDALANVKHSMKILEEGGLYSELLHKFKLLEHEFEEDAKEWAKYAIARDLLARTIDRYKEERMPRMLEKAERFLSLLTDGKYVRILPRTQGSGFLIERNDHMLFEANELSQATAEQVYVSIRMALTAVHYERYPFPIIIDDSFVNFDHNRTARIIELLRDMSGNQILLFSCHRHLLEYFSNEEIINLEEKSSNIV